MIEENNPFTKRWKDLESDSNMPRYARRLITVNYSEFAADVVSGRQDFVEQITDSLYSGDVYILKNGFPKVFLDDLLEKVYKIWHSEPSSFHKMLEGCPDFHRIQDEEVAKKYVFESVRHSYYWFDWNGDPMGVIPEIQKRWRIFKYLGGYKFNEYEGNTPKDGIVDRYQVARYLPGLGRSETHSDPYQNQKFFISAFMSKKGETYEKGGFYVVGPDDKFIDIEDEIEVGDIGIGYATVLHGVALVDEGSKVDWGAKDGRWWR